MSSSHSIKRGASDPAETTNQDHSNQTDHKRIKSTEEKPAESKPSLTTPPSSSTPAGTEFSRSLFGTFSEPNASSNWTSAGPSLVAPSALSSALGASSTSTASVTTTAANSDASKVDWKGVLSAPASSFFTQTQPSLVGLPTFSLPASFVNPLAGGSTFAPLFGSAPVQPKGTSRSGDGEEEGGGNDSDNGGGADEEEPIVNPALISKPAVHVTGEERETHAHTVHCKLFQMDEASNKWKEKGAGTLRINSNKDQPTEFRLVMRSDRVYRLLLNSPLWKTMPSKFIEPSCVCIAAVVDPETIDPTTAGPTCKKAPLASFLLKTARKEEATDLFDAIEKFKAQTTTTTAGASSTSSSATQASTTTSISSASPTTAVNSSTSASAGTSMLAPTSIPTQAKPSSAPPSPARREESPSSVARHDSSLLPPPSPKTARSPTLHHTSASSIASSITGAAFLQEAKASELLHVQTPSSSGTPAKVVYANPTDNAETILKLLSEHNIYAVPVMSNHGTKLVGSVDLADLAAFLVSEAAALGSPTSLRAGTAPNYRSESSRVGTHHFDSTSLARLKASFFGALASRLSNFSRQNNMFSLELEKSSVWSVIKRLSDNVRRVALTDTDGRVVKIASQSTVIAFLAKHVDRLGPKVETTLEMSKCISRPLVSISPKLRALDAFVRLVDCRLSALAYLGDDGDVLGNISVKDLKGVLHDFNNLLLPVEEFVNINRRAIIKDMPALVSIQPTDTIHKAMQKLAAVGVHRLYVFSEPTSRNPMGMVALSDVLRYICKELSA